MRDSLTAQNGIRLRRRIVALLALLLAAAMFLTVSVYAEDIAAQPGGGAAAPAGQTEAAAPAVPASTPDPDAGTEPTPASTDPAPASPAPAAGTEPDAEQSDPQTGDPETGTLPAAGTSGAAEPKTGEPDTTAPDSGDPAGTDPDGTNPDTTDPDGGDPDTIDPDGTDPDTTNPDGGDPDGEDPEEEEDGLESAGASQADPDYQPPEIPGEGEGLLEDNGGSEVEEDFMVPEGSATVSVNGKTLDSEPFKNDTANNAVVNALNGAVSYLKTNLPQLEGDAVQIEIVVTAGTYQGDVDISAGSQLYNDLLDAIQYHLTGGDPGDPPIEDDAISSALFTDTNRAYPYAAISIVTDQYKNGQASDGSASMEGNILTDGFDLLLAGLYFSSKEQIRIKNALNFTYEGTELDDNPVIRTENVAVVRVNSGGGDDRIDLEVVQAPSATVGIGNSNPLDIINAVEDIYNASQSGTAQDTVEYVANEFAMAIKQQVEALTEDLSKRVMTQVEVTTGEGTDDLLIRLVNSTNFYPGTGGIDPRTGKYMALYNFDIDLGGTDLTVDLGGGADTMTVTGGLTMTTGRNLYQEFSRLIGKYYLKEDARDYRSRYVISGGDGDDVINLDSTSAFHDVFGLDVTINETETGGYDRLHLTGNLAVKNLYADGQVLPDIPFEERIARLDEDGDGVAEGLRLKVQSVVQVLPDLTGALGDVTQGVLNTVALQQEMEIRFGAGLDAVTDRLENKRTVVLGNVSAATVTVQDFTDYVVSSLSLDPDTESVTVGLALTVQGLANYMANLLVQATELIRVERLLAPGLTILLEAPQVEILGPVTGEHILILAQAEDPDVLGQDALNITVADDELTGTTMEYGVGLYEAASAVRITLAEGAALTAEGAVDLTASIRQTSGMVDVMAGVASNFPNFIIVKKPTAEILLQGSIIAGQGAIRALASTLVDFDCAELLSYIPLSFAWGEARATILVDKQARLTSGAGTALRTDSEVYISAVDKGSFPKALLSLSSAVAIAETETIVTDAASLTAGGDVLLDARTRMNTEASSIAGPTDVARMKPKSGVFVAVSVALGRTGVYVGDYGEITGSTASVISTGGSVRAEADSLLRNRTYAISSPISVYVQENGTPLFTEQPTQKQSLRSMVSLTESVFGLRAGTSGTPAWAISKVTGSNTLGSLFNNGVAEADPNQDIASTQAMGALALAILDNEILARIATSGVVSAAQGGVQLHTYGETTSQTRADGSLYNNATLAVIPGFGKVQITKDPKNTAAGIAVNVTSFTHNAEARIQRGTVTAGKALAVTVENRRVDSSAIAKSGHIPPAETAMLGGAVTVQVITLNSHAALSPDAEYRLGEGADLTVASRVADSRLETVADASGKRARRALGMFPLENEKTYSRTSLGVGAGIAVAVTGIDVIASIPDGVVFRALDGSLPADASLGNLTVDSYYMGSERVFAAAGASGGTSLTPVSATSISGVYLLSELGESGSQGVDLAGELALIAQNRMIRFLTADAASAGTNVGIGAAVAVGVYNDSADSQLRRRAKARKNLSVAAESVSRVTQTVRASTQGALAQGGTGTPQDAASAGDAGTEGLVGGTTKPSGGTSSNDGSHLSKADQTADQKLNNGKALAGRVNTRNTNASMVEKAAANRSPFETMEGSIQVAAAIAVNLQNNLSRALIADVDVSAGEDITVLSRNDTDAKVSANAGTTNSYVGVGAAAAVNMVDHQNIAQVGSGKLSAGGAITVAAEIYEKSQADLLDQAYDLLVDYLLQTGKLDVLLDAVGDNALTTSAEYIFLDLQAKQDLTDEEKQKLAQAVADMIAIALWQQDLKQEEWIKVGDVVVDGAGQRTLTELLEDLILAEYNKNNQTPLTMDHLYGLEQYVIAAVTERYTGTANPYAAYGAQWGYADLTASLISDLETMMAYAAQQRVLGYQLMPLLLKLAAGEAVALTDEQKQAIDQLLGLENPTDEQRAEAAKEYETILTEQIKASLTGDTNTARQNAELYSDALAAYIEDVFAVLGDADNWKPYFDKEQLLVQIPALDKISAELTQLGFAVNDIYEAFAALMTTKFATGSELDGVGHTISTQAVSGVGASNVGVAGSAAITIINAVSSATIAGRSTLAAEPDITAGGDIRVEANEAQKVYTTASASADKSLGMAAKAATARKPGSSVGVGASFATNLITALITARIGTETTAGDAVTTLGNRNIRAKALALLATFRDDVDTVTVAGSDPIARRDKAYEYLPTLGVAADKSLAQAAANGTNTKGISFDAGVAVAVVNNVVKAALLSGSRLVTTNSLDTIESAILTGQTAQGEDVFAMANVLVQALYGGDSYTAVSAFAAGSRAAVGAAVGVSLVESDITASLEADTTAAGSVRVHSATDVTDESYALATSIGADLDRLLEKFREGLNYISPGAAENSTIRNQIVGATNKMGAVKLQEKANQAGGSIAGKLDAVPYSSNLLKTFGLDLTKTTSGTSGLDASVSGSGAQVAGVQPQTSSLNVAAAIALAFTEHHTLARILGNVTSRNGDVQARAENVVNFRNRASGATVTTAPVGANTVAAAVAVTLNENTAQAGVADGVTLNAKGDVSVTADTTQNLTGNYPGYMSAQAVAASIATGMQGTLGVAGAVAVLTDKADTLALVGDNATILAGGDVLVAAADLSKLAIRALGANIGAQTVGVGAAFALLHSFSDIHAELGDDLAVTARTLTVTADRPLVDESLYQFPFDWSDLLTVSNQDATVGDTDKGLMHITLPDDLAHLRQIKMECTIGTDDLLDVLDMINYLATVNYYVEAVSGSLHHGVAGAANVAGTVAQLLAENSVRAAIGSDASLTLGKNEAGESLTVAANSSAIVRVIAGSASLGSAKAGVGAVVSLARMQDVTEARIGDATRDGRTITAAGDVTVTAAAKNDVWDVATADAVTGGGMLTLGGGFNLVDSSTRALASVGSGVTILADGSFAINGDNELQLTLIAANMGLAAGSANVAAGGTVAWTDIRNETGARVGDNTLVKAASVALTADSTDRVMEILASASAAPSGTVGAAATLARFGTSSETMALAGSGAYLEAASGDVLLHAFNDTDLLAALLAFSATGKSTGAAGATVLIQQFSQKAHAGAGVSEDAGVTGQSATLIARRGSVLVESRANNRSLAVGAAIAPTGSTTLDLAGTYLHQEFASEAVSRLGDNTTAEAWDSIGILADADNQIVAGAGGLAAAGSATASLGGSAVTVILKNLVQALAGENSAITAWALNTGADAGIRTANREDRRRGVVVHAFSNETIYMAAAAGTVSGSSTVNLAGVADTLLVRNIVNAHVGNNSRVSAGLSSAEHKDVDGDGQSDDSHGAGEILIEALDNTYAINFGGALSASGSATASLGGTVVTIRFEKEVSAILDGGSGSVHAESTVTVDADSIDKLFLLAATFGVTGGTASAGAAGSILLYEDAVRAHLGGQITSGGDVKVTADTAVDLYNVALSLAGAATADIAGTAVVTSFQGLTEAVLLAGASVDTAGSLAVLANAREFITADGAGISGSGTAAVSGTVNVILTENTVLAIVQDNADGTKPVIRASSITLDALDDYQLIGAAASAALSGTAGVGVTAIVTLADNQVAAGIGSNYDVRTFAGDVLVNALSKRDVRTYAGSVGVSATAGVGAVIMALVVGGKLDDDSSAALLAHFDPDALLTGMQEKAPAGAQDVYDGHNGAWLRDALAGSGNKYSDVPVDDAYDGADQYISEDFNQDYTVTQNTDGTVTAGEPGADMTVTPVGSGSSDADEACKVYEGFKNVASAAFTRAFIGANTTVTSAGGITVRAKDQLNASLGTVAFGASGAVGVGVGMAVAILNGSVEAWAGEGSVLSAAGDITIEAIAESPLLAGGDLSENDRESADFLNSQSEEFDVTDLTIHALSVSGGVAGTAGVGVALAVVHLGSSVSARLLGSVEEAGVLTIRAVSDYRHIVAATLSLGGGMAGVSASVAVTLFDGSTRASVEGTGSVQDVAGVRVETQVNNTAASAAAGIAAGMGAVNAGAAVAINKSLVETFIAQGVSTGGSVRTPDITLNALVNSDAKAFTLGVTGGAVAVGAAVALAKTAPTVRTYIGAAPDATQFVAPGTVNAGSITIRNDVSTTAESYAANVTGGAVGVTAQVLLVFNTANLFAGLDRVNVNAGSVTIDSAFHASGRAYVASLTGGAVAVGMVISTVLLQAENTAQVDVTGVEMNFADLQVSAGRQNDPNTSSAEALALAAGAGAVSAGLNAAVADNNTRNIARVLGGKEAGSHRLNVTGALNLGSFGQATANAQVWGVNAGAISVLGSAAVAMLRAEQQANVAGGNITAGSLTARSGLNEGLDRMKYVDLGKLPGGDIVAAPAEDVDASEGNAAVFAGLITGSGGAVSAVVNVAAAYGRALTQAVVAPFSLSLSGKADVLAGGTANVLAQSFNQSAGAITAAVIVNTAYSQSEFTSILDIPAGSSVTAGSVSVATDYTASAVAALAPSAGGADLSGAALQVNVGVANADSRGKAAVTGAGLLTAGTLSVTGRGVATSRVYSVTPVVSLTAVRIAANVLVALLDAENLACIQGVEVRNAAITVNARLNAADGQGVSALLANNIKGSGVSVSLASARSNTAVALNRSVNKAFMDSVKVTAGAALSVTATANSLASASAADPGTGVELLSLGVNVIVARADGTFAAYIHMAEDRPVSAASVTVTNTYNARAEAVSRQPNQGVGLLDAGTNVAYANAGALAEAAIKGSAGSVTTGGAVNILLTGKATADALIAGTKVNVQGAELAVNLVDAIVSACQQAYIGQPEGGSASAVNVTAVGGITILASLNNSAETGAKAIVGSNGSDSSVAVSIIGGKASEASARMEGASSVHIRTTGSIVTAGQLSLLNTARSWAKADIADASVDVTLVNATLLLTEAVSGGTFKALAETGALSAGGVDIQNIYYAESRSATGPAGGVGVNLVNTDANRADAETSATADASLKVTGSASVTNSVNIRNTGYLLAEALGRTRKVNVSGVSIAVTVVDAVLQAEQTAAAQFDGEAVIGGQLNVNSEIVRSSGYGVATAQAGGSGGANVSLVGAGVNDVNAQSATTNTASLTGAGTLNTGSVSVRAKSLTEAEATAKSGVDVGLVLLGSLNASSSTRDKVDVLVEGLTVNASGTFTAEAVGNTVSEAVAASEGGGGLVTAGVNTATAKVGGSGDAPQTVHVTVKGSTIEAARDVTLRAYNTGDARANIERGLNIAAGSLTVSVLPTNAWYNTGVDVLEGAVVRSTGGSVSVLSEDAPKGRSEARGTTIGIGVNASVTYGENTADTTNTISVNGTLDASEALTVEAVSAAQLNAATYADGGGVFSGTTLWSKNTLNRAVSILIGENSALLANYGDLTVNAVGGTRDSIITRSEVSSGGVVALGTATALVNIDNDVKVQISKNALVRARFSAVNIYADASQAGVQTNVSADASGLGVAPNSTANVNTSLDADVVIAGTAGEPAVIEGRDVEIIARNGEVDIYTYTYAKGSALGAAVNAISNPKTTLTADVNIAGADITGHDSLHIYASTKPAYRDANIDVRATIQLNAAGEALARAGGSTTAHSNTVLGSGVTLRGATVAVTRYGFDRGRIRRDARKGGFIIKETSTSHSFTSDGTVAVNGGTALYLGDAAGGAYIDISEHKGQLTVRQVGIKEPDSYYAVNGNTVTLSDITNNLPGVADFTHEGKNASGSVTVYNQAVLPRVIITNSSGFDVQLNGIYVTNSGFIQPSVFGIGHTISDVAYDKPEVRTESRGTGGVQVSGFVSNTDGHVEFVWTGEEGGALTGVDSVADISSGATVSPVWAHDLLVKGAASVGTASQAFNAYVFSGSSGVVNIEASGDVFVNIVPVTLIIVDKDNQELERHTDPVYIERVVSLNGNVEMDLQEGVQATMIAGTTTVTIPVPGTLSYITSATVELASNYTLTGKDVLDYYLQGYDAAERLYRTCCPTAPCSTWTPGAMFPASKRAAPKHRWATSSL